MDLQKTVGALCNPLQILYIAGDILKIVSESSVIMDGRTGGQEGVN